MDGRRHRAIGYKGIAGARSEVQDQRTVPPVRNARGSSTGSEKQGQDRRIVAGFNARRTGCSMCSDAIVRLVAVTMLVKKKEFSGDSLRRCQLGGVISMTTRYCARQVISTRIGISFLIGTVRNFGGSILNSDTVAGIVPVILIRWPCASRRSSICLNWTVWPAN
jgi:hypothetical protein